MPKKKHPCPKCGQPMHKAGGGWSGGAKYQRYAHPPCNSTHLDTSEPYQPKAA